MFATPLIIRLDNIDSTSNYTANLVKQTKVPEFSLIMTKRQTKGRGQRGTSWISEPGKNFTGTFVLYPKVDLSDYFKIQKMTALATLELIQKKVGNKNVQIKWPNDIYVNQNKIAGILLESQVKNGKFEYILAGIGVNVNQIDWEIDAPITSLQLECGYKIDLTQLSEEFQTIMSKIYLRYNKNINTIYNANLYGMNRWMKFKNSLTKDIFNAKIIGVSDSGLLKLQMECQKVETFDIKEVEFTHEYLEDV